MRVDEVNCGQSGPQLGNIFEKGTKLFKNGQRQISLFIAHTLALLPSVKGKLALAILTCRKGRTHARAHQSNCKNQMQSEQHGTRCCTYSQNIIGSAGGTAIAAALTALTALTSFNVRRDTHSALPTALSSMFAADAMMRSLPRHAMWPHTQREIAHTRRHTYASLIQPVATKSNESGPDLG